MKNSLLIAIAGALLAAMLWWQNQLGENLTSPMETPVSASDSATPMSQIEQEPMRNDPVLTDANNPPPDETPDSVIGSTANNDTFSDPSLRKEVALWQIGERESLVDDVIRLSYDPAAIERLQKGDTFAFQTPTGEEYQATVSDTGVSEEGTLSITASYEAYSEPYNVVISQGPVQTFITISAPEGTLEMQGQNGQGTLKRQPVLDQLIDPQSTDIMAAPTEMPKDAAPPMDKP